MPDKEAPHTCKQKVLNKLKHSPFSLSAVLIIVSYLGFMSMSLIPLTNDNFKEYTGNPFSADNPAPESVAITSEPTQLPATYTASPAPTTTLQPKNTSSSTPIPSKTSSPVPSATVTPELVNFSEQVSMDWGDWTCRYCDKMPVKVKMTHYWPPLGGENCWWFYEGYCHSPMKSSVPWETLIEIAAACPPHWLGGVVEIPEIGRRYLCLDTGDKVICENDICIVDVLTDKRYPWDGLIYDAVVYYPRVWTDGSRPQVTPFADHQDASP
jgi:hypothetical protein